MKKLLLYNGKANPRSISQEHRNLIAESWNENRARLIFKDAIVIAEESKKLWVKAKSFKDVVISMPGILKGKLEDIHIPQDITREEVKLMRIVYSDGISTADCHRRLLNDRIRALKLYQGLTPSINRGSIEYGKPCMWGINYIPVMVSEGRSRYFDLDLNHLIESRNSINEIMGIFDNMSWHNTVTGNYKLPQLVNIREILDDSITEA